MTGCAFETTKGEAPRPLAGLKVHFAGICGIGMSGLAHLAAARGAIVSGCDVSTNGQAGALAAAGIRLWNGHSPEHVGGHDLVVHTAAMPEDHPELAAARELGISVLSRTRMLARIQRDYKSLCVTGAHGKTTTTWMLARLLIVGGLDPTVLVGGVVSELNGNWRAGKGRWLVCEVDESDGQMVEMRPDASVITNVDREHLEHCGGFEGLLDEFRRYMAATEVGGLLAICGDDPHLPRLARDIGRKAVRYGLSEECDVLAENLRLYPMASAFDAVGPWGRVDGITLPMPGRHNVVNALAAVVVAREMGICEARLREALASCPRVNRRLQIRGDAFGATVVEDYGHHPTEIRETLRAARRFCREKLLVVFQPHRYTRTKCLMTDFATAFDDADRVLVLPIYAASEAPIEGVDSARLVEAISAQGNTEVEAVGDFDAAVRRLSMLAGPGDVILIQGAGDVYKVADKLVG
ncbi:MAG: UDP-N-acetylmuramate--L-alanine ligase [Planctomycetota bacterium]|nr:UDP-N-acetylmuramate--L-alanine ligase [Planctomycetota bacterium]